MRRSTGCESGRAAFAGLLVVVLVAAVALVLLRDRLPWAGDGADNPFADRELLVRTEARVGAAAEQARADGDEDAADVLDRMAKEPTGIWLLPEAHGTPDDVGSYVEQVVGQADDEDRLALLVVYGITDRDCTGQLSSGGLPADEYLPWVEAIADASAGVHTAVVLEPDALVSATQCDIEDQRVDQLRDAVGVFADAGVTTYVDAGHPAWLDASATADLLERVGVASVRGFSANVSNYQPLASVTAWAEAVSEDLGGSAAAHFVIDTSRNGANAGTVADWCNPPGQALGVEPGYVDDGTPLDALLWVKPPWESDGTCNGGPDAGGFWLERALQLAAAAGW